jgi:hypothetical protein
MLKSVSRPLGGGFELAYERSGNTYEHPHSRWMMNRVTLHDGHPGDGPDTLTTTFDYRDEQGRKAGIYNRLEREFYGYPVVIQEQGEADGADVDAQGIGSADAETARIFPQLERTETFFHEGLDNQIPGKSSLTTFEYDLYGNVKRFVDAGAVNRERPTTPSR